jgi:hypothetical protein
VSNNGEPAVPAGWTRCWLVSWKTAGAASYAEAKAGNIKPTLAIDVSSGEIRVIDLSSNALIGSAPLAQVTASPAARMGSYWDRRYAPKGLPVIVVNLPGVPQLTVGCIEPSQKLSRFGWRFWWRERVAHVEDPEYLVSGPGWLTLVEKFGLASQLGGFEPPALEDRLPSPTSAPAAPPPLYTPSRYQKPLSRLAAGYFIFCVVFLVALLVLAAVLHQF